MTLLGYRYESGLVITALEFADYGTLVDLLMRRDANNGAIDEAVSRRIIRDLDKGIPSASHTAILC